MTNRTCIFFLLACVFAGCHFSSRPGYVIAPADMKKIMFDMVRMDQYYSVLLGKDSTLKKKKEDLRLYEEVYALHHITKEQFDKSFKYYEAHPIELKALVDSLDAYAVRERQKIPVNHGQSH